MATKKKKKKGIAIPFLTTILLSLIIIGIPTYMFYQNIAVKDEPEKTEDFYGNYIPSTKDNCTILFILDLDDTEGQDTFMLFRTMPKIDIFGCVPIANSTLSTYENTADTIENIYLKNGISGVRQAIENTFEIKIDRYIKLNEQSFQKICDILGGANYYVPSDVKGFNQGQMFLSSQQIQSLVTHYEFDDEDRNYVIGSLITTMLNQAMGDRVSENLDNSFNSLIDIMDTDVTTIDYKNGKKAIQYMFSDDNYYAEYKLPKGNYNANNQFIVSDDFKQELALWFVGEVEEVITETTLANMGGDTTTAIVTEEVQTAVDTQMGEQTIDNAFDGGETYDQTTLEEDTQNSYEEDTTTEEDYSYNDDSYSDDSSNDDSSNDYNY